MPQTINFFEVFHWLKNTTFLRLCTHKNDSCHLPTLLGQALMNSGDYLHITRRVMVPIRRNWRNGYSGCLFPAHGLLKYTVFCFSGSYRTIQSLCPWYYTLRVFWSFLCDQLCQNLLIRPCSHFVDRCSYGTIFVGIGFVSILLWCYS